MRRDNLLLSPLFSTKNQAGGLFRGFTPKNCLLTPTFDVPQGMGYEDPRYYPTMDPEVPHRMDKLVDSLKMEIKNRITMNQPNSRGLQGGLNLDIDLINDTYGNEVVNKSPNGNTPFSRAMDLASARKYGELTLSPNSSFLPRKK